MRITHIKLDTFMVKIARTRDVEPSCDDCARHSARLVDALMQGNVEDSELLDILHHVLQCMPCSQEFQVLQQCARMDAEDSWPSFDEMWNKIEQKK
jgi:hypothetical protein